MNGAVLFGLCMSTARDGGTVVVPPAAAGVAAASLRAPSHIAGRPWRAWVPQPGEFARLSAEPVLRIGGIDADERDAFGDVTGIVVFSDRRLAVADGMNARVTVYDPRGTFLRSQGRKGEGPGEYRDLSGLVQLPGDSLLVPDRGLQRFTVLSPSGHVMRSVAYPTRMTISRTDVVGVLPGGDIVLKQLAGGVITGTSAGLVRDSLTYYRYSPAAPSLRTIARLPGLEHAVVWDGARRSVSTRALARDGLATLLGEYLVYSSTEEPAVSLLASDGRTHRVLREERRVRVVSTAERTRHRKEVLEGFKAHPAMQAMVAKGLADDMYPKRLPSYRRLLTDREGRIWASEYVFPWEATTRWTVFEPNGTVLGSVRVPSRFDPMVIERDRVVGVWRDELDVQEVRAYALQRAHER